jgi:hypothetical protein
MENRKKAGEPSGLYQRILDRFKNAGVVFRNATTFDLVHNQPPVNWSIRQMSLASLVDGVTLIIGHMAERGKGAPEAVVVRLVQNMGEENCRAVRLDYDYPQGVWMRSAYIPRHDILDAALAVLLRKGMEPPSPLAMQKRISARAAMRIIDGLVSVSSLSLSSRRT